MPVVYGDMLSGNCYKIALLFSQLNIDHEWKEILVTRGESKTQSFLAMNPAGQIPVVVLDDDTVLTQSNAILHYFAEQSPLLPVERLDRTRLLEWQFFEQYSHEPTIAVRRFIKKYQGLPAERQSEFDALEAGSYRALQVMEKRLAGHDFLVGNRYSLADISLYAYTHVAHEADLDLTPYPGIERWLGTVAGQPGYIAMDATGA
jgi:glutathione S-transferase